MNIQRSHPINISRYGRSRHKSHDFEELSCLRSAESQQSFSPNLGSPSPPETPDSSHCISRIGDYLLLEPLEGDHVFRAAHLHSGEELVCKIIRAIWRGWMMGEGLRRHRPIPGVTGGLLRPGPAPAHQPNPGDPARGDPGLRALRERAMAMTCDMHSSTAVAHCHDNGLVLRDLKLRKFVFKNEDRSLVKLESLEDTYILDGHDDSLSDKHGCPPRLRQPRDPQRQRQLLGEGGRRLEPGRHALHHPRGALPFPRRRARLPVQQNPCRGHFNIPETLTPKAKCLIRSILRREPA
ncbi:hypothetical protein L3Q82_011319 [Scortum barcoo]|uniref:Uncharacterized protein n=1 Tax=Scortum barcoo TaxID=214431 RepID=A0ACB8W9T1_9TELE|nr:hypothetical protein L3Q82_011319 [Scortum barcoo]